MQALYIATIKICLTKRKSTRKEKIYLQEYKYPVTLDENNKIENKLLIRIINLISKGKINSSKLDQYDIKYEINDVKFSSNLYSQL